MSANLEVQIDGLSASGDGVGRLPDGRVVFVPATFPGDRVRVSLAGTHKRVQYAELVDLLAPSVDRVDSRCKIQSCGGCALRGLTPVKQGELKRQRVVETLRRIGNIDVQSMLPGVAQQGDGWRARHRVRLHAAWTGTRYRLGYHGRKSRDLSPLTSCPILWHELEQAALRLGNAVESLPEAAGLTEVEIAYSRRDGRAGARLEGQGSLAVFREWLEKLPDLGAWGLEIEADGGVHRHGNLELRYDHRRADEFDLRYTPDSFTQANPDMNDLLVDAVLAWVQPARAPRLLELHAGIGNFSVPLGLAGVRVTAIERHRRAAVLCRRNAKNAGIELEVRDESDLDAVLRLNEFDTVLLDPPRTGARGVAEAIGAASSISRVVYVSCDAATLARDASLMVGAGMRVIGLQAFDMFPETPHVEVVMALER